MEIPSLGSVFRLRNGSGTVKTLFVCLILCNFLAALCGIVAILTGLVPEILHLAMDFAKEVLVGLVFHDEQFTPGLAVTGGYAHGLLRGALKSQNLRSNRAPGFSATVLSKLGLKYNKA